MPFCCVLAITSVLSKPPTTLEAKSAVTEANALCIVITYSWMSQGIILAHGEYHLMSIVLILVTNAIV